MASKEIKTTRRFRSIDGMRGLAALAVVLFHLSIKMKEELQAVLPDFLTIVMSYGYLGVPVFFVISGIVISLSVNDKKVTLIFWEEISRTHRRAMFCSICFICRTCFQLTR